MDPLLKTVLSRSYQAPANPALVREIIMDIARYARSLEAAVPADAFGNAASTPGSSTPSPSPANDTTEHSQADNIDIEVPEDDATVALSDTLKRSLVLTGSRDRFFGPSSSVALLDTTTLELARVSVIQRCVAQKPAALALRQHMRPEFWTVHPWEQIPPKESRPFDFPPPDLLDHLIQLYFDTANLYMPLLHRSTFENAYKSKLHLSDPCFGQVVLGVCAIAARYSNDERVLLEGTTSLQSSGYKWFRQLKLFQDCFLRAPSLYELQALCLAVIYIQGISTSEKCWYVVGLGVRAAQDIGLNKKGAGAKPTVEGELRKRVFWMLLFLDSLVAASVGRPASMNISDFDVEMPIDCDDEYWDHPDPELAFKQPLGTPSKSSYFCLILKLVEIHASSHRAFYSVRRPTPPPGVSPVEWDRTTLANLDSALNAWAESVPDHLRWDPDRLEGIFLNQSAELWTTYYTTQILAHRPFVSCPHHHKSLALTSLAICTNAARACIRIMEIQSRKGKVLAPHAQTSLFTAGLMLLLNFWRAKHTGIALADEARDINAIFTCIKVLETYEERWHSAGRFRDIMMALVSMSKLSLVPVNRPKRRRTDEEDEDEIDSDCPGQQCSVAEATTDPCSTKSRASPPTNDLSSLDNHTLVTGITDPTESDMTTAAFNDIPPIGGPLYSFSTPDLEGSFSQLNGFEKGQNMTWREQMQALYGYNGHPDPLAASEPTHDASTGVPHSSDIFFGIDSATAAPSTSTSAASSQWPTGSYTNAQPAVAPAIEQGNNLIGTQDAALWMGVPSGYDLNDWGRYLSYVEAFNDRAQPPPDLSAFTSHEAPDFSFSF